MMSSRELRELKYSELKNDIYRIYLEEVQSPTGNINDRFMAAINKAGKEFINIAEDTIKFPFDKELYDFYKSNLNLNLNDFVTNMSTTFDLSIELTTSKIKEYVNYDFNKLVSTGKIKKDLVDGMTSIYNQKEERKINK